MRISTEPDDPGFYNCVKFRDVAKVFFNGCLRNGVITADEEKRYIIAYMYDEKGSFILDDDRLWLKTEKLFGDVRIEIPGLTDLVK